MPKMSRQAAQRQRLLAAPPRRAASSPVNVWAAALVSWYSPRPRPAVRSCPDARTGLTAAAELDPGEHPKGIKISDRQMKDLEQRALRHHQFHGEWNYDLIPARGP